MLNKIILPYDIIGNINSFLPRPIHPTAKIIKNIFLLYKENLDMVSRYADWYKPVFHDWVLFIRPPLKKTIHLFSETKFRTKLLL